MKDECSQRTFATELTRYACLIPTPGNRRSRFRGVGMFSLENSKAW